MCNSCIHAPVCGKCRATGGNIHQCEHYSEERRGRWIETDEGTICSECYEHPFEDGYLAIANYNGDWCPNCGAKMDK